MLRRLETVRLIESPLLRDEKWLAHGFGLKGIPVETYLRELALEGAYVPQTRQVHGDRIHVLNINVIPADLSAACPPAVWRGSLAEAGIQLLQGDAFVTDIPGRVCLVRSADCLPILLADVRRKVVAAIHAGWRGTVSDIALKTVTLMKEKWGSRAEDLIAALGPSIEGACYPVGADVASLLPDGVEPAGEGIWKLDLARVHRDRLVSAGLSPGRIGLSGICTACAPELLASHRRDGRGAGRQTSFILIRK